MSYAANTTVPIDRSRAAIEALVREKGATQFMAASDYEHGGEIIGWTMEGRMVRLSVPIPTPDEDRFKRRSYRGHYTWREFPKETQRKLWEQACRSRWRAVLLILVAKFEACESGISTFEREFLADTVMADGQTVARWLQPQLNAMYASGSMPKMLPGLGETSR